MIHIICAVLATVSVSAQTEQILDSSLEYLTSESVHAGSAWVRLETPLNETILLSIRMECLRNELDYAPNVPVDPFGAARKLEEDLAGAQLSLKLSSHRTEWAVVASAYDGFRNFSSIWIDEYYRQQYGEGGLPGVTYRDPSPKGQGLDISFKREVIPAIGYLSLSVGYLNDQVAPGYEIEDLGDAFELVRGESTLNTITGSISWEGVINKAMRTRQALRVTDTAGRDLRWSWSGDLNWLVADRWILRSTASFVDENPTFEAWSLSESIEYQVGGNWSVGGTLRYYSDTGQIESANLISSAAPALTSRQAMLSLRYENKSGTTGISFSMGPYWTRYGRTGIGTERFQLLYGDRDWWLFRIAARHRF